MSVYEAVSKNKKIRTLYALNGRMLIKTESNTIHCQHRWHSDIVTAVIHHLFWL